MIELTAPTLAMKAAVLRYQEEFAPATAGSPG